MSESWERLREERVRLGLTQIDFGQLGGVRPVAQHNYEKGLRQPDMAYLSAIAAAGADVCYILTGRRTGTASDCAPSLRLTGEEKELLEAYHLADEMGRDVLLAAARAIKKNVTTSKTSREYPGRDQLPEDPIKRAS